MQFFSVIFCFLLTAHFTFVAYQWSWRVALMKETLDC
jgi:hypothetical protein